jgi:hypothetical protein
MMPLLSLQDAKAVEPEFKIEPGYVQPVMKVQSFQGACLSFNLHLAASIDGVIISPDVVPQKPTQPYRVYFRLGFDSLFCNACSGAKEE